MAHTLAAWLALGVSLGGVTAPSPQSAANAGTRAQGLRAGPYAVGFERRLAVDVSRRINEADEGTRISLAVWYPAEPSSAAAPRVTSLEYRLLELGTTPDEAERTAYEAREIDILQAVRHVGIVDLTREQARAALRASGLAVRDAPSRAGRWPIVVVVGGPWYLSTTAEILASHGFLVFSAMRVSDQSNEIAPKEFTYSWYLENVVRDAEWGLAEIRRDPRADASRVIAIGHGGGGMNAMWLAMRNRQVTATVNVDAANFSTRSGGRSLPFYGPRLMRTPYLYIATAATRRDQDQFEDFQQMAFADRYEVVLERPTVRHHDLSDVGRAITAPLGIRGEAADVVQQSYGEVQEMIVRFAQMHANGSADARGRWRDWLLSQNQPGAYTVAVTPGREPAPTLARVLDTLDATTAARLRDARQRDPDAPVFQADALERITARALTLRAFEAADGVSEIGAELYPASPLFVESRSHALEARGDIARALDAARACAAMSPGGNWRAIGAVNRCQSRAARLDAR